MRGGGGIFLGIYNQFGVTFKDYRINFAFHTREITKSAAEAYAERGSVEGRSFELAKASSPKSFHHNYTATEAILSLMAV